MGGQVPQKKSWVEQAHAALQVPTPMISIAKMSVPFHTNVWQSLNFHCCTIMTCRVCITQFIISFPKLLCKFPFDFVCA